MILAPVIAIVLAAAVSTTDVLLDYSPEKIEELVQSGDARPHGAQFAASIGALNCCTYYWERSNDHHVFFFLRDGKSYGEYRDEVLSEGRYLQIKENYLAADQRKTPTIAPPTQRRYIRRDEILIWEAGKWIASDVQWTFIWAEENGTISRTEMAAKERIIKRDITVTVPSHLLRSSIEYYVKAFRPQATEHEKAFGDNIVGLRYHLATDKVSGNRCRLRLQWPSSRPLLLLELHERVPNPPLDATPFVVRTESVGSMAVRGDSLGGQELEFDPE